MWAYIGTEVYDSLHDQMGIVVRDYDTGSPDPMFEVAYCNSEWATPVAMSHCTINGQPVTHFQPIKAEVRFLRVHGTFEAFVNDVSVGPFHAELQAKIFLRDLSRSLAPWWKGELKIEERV